MISLESVAAESRAAAGVGSAVVARMSRAKQTSSAE